ncbi:MAG: nascent polypeptide-associated complex protein [Candidatus Bathyarchaeota archaeon]|nr:nascent polypeptide-associated complex protein [Candidatus Bathyarchaeota archaeon]
MAHKAFRSIKGIPQGRNAMRMMQRMGMETNEIKDVIEVIIKTADKDIIIEEPNVMSLVMDRQKIFQVIGGNQREEIPDQDTVEISENDIKLVAEQANVDAEEARHALEESGGDLARAIVLLKAEEK